MTKKEFEKYKGNISNNGHRIVGYRTDCNDTLISENDKGWTIMSEYDVVEAKCNGYWYVNIKYVIL